MDNPAYWLCPDDQCHKKRGKKLWWKIERLLKPSLQPSETQRKHRKHRYENISSAVDLFLNRNMTLLRSIFVVDVFTSLLNAKLDSQPVCACLVCVY